MTSVNDGEKKACGGAAVENPVAVMKRYEMKYLIDAEQQKALRRGLEGRMEVDRFGLTTISSLYYDTPDNRLIGRSIERPLFKEKMRLRSYGQADESSPVFLELKRKAYGVVYKRRVQSTIPEVVSFMSGKGEVGGDDQIRREIGYFRDFYGNLEPACMIIYERTAFFEPGGSLRLTIDEAPRFRATDLSLTLPPDGERLLPEGHAILEIKVQDAMPLWLSKILDGARIFKNSFSKYGEAYKRLQGSRNYGGYCYV